MTFAEAIAWTDAHGLTDHCKRIAAEAPPFTEAQRELLAAMLATGRARLAAEAAA